MSMSITSCAIFPQKKSSLLLHGLYGRIKINWFLITVMHTIDLLVEMS